MAVLLFDDWSTRLDGGMDGWHAGSSGPGIGEV